MTALSLVMRVAGALGEVEMAASHVVMQYMLLISLGLDGFAHATEALAGSAWGEGKARVFHHWVKLTGIWALAASVAYALRFWLAGTSLTALLTDLSAVRVSVEGLMPMVIALPIVAVACYQFDGVFIAATAGCGNDGDHGDCICHLRPDTQSDVSQVGPEGSMGCCFDIHGSTRYRSGHLVSCA